MRFAIFTQNYSRLAGVFFLLMSATTFTHAQTNSNTAPDIIWSDIKQFGVEGRGWTNTKNFYDRLPAKAAKVRTMRDTVQYVIRGVLVYIRYVRTIRA